MKDVLRIRTPKLVERMHRVRRPRQTKLEVGRPELRIALDGKLNQLQTQRVVHQFVGLFQRISRANHKPYLVQSLVLAKVVGQSQMSDMNGIEGAAENADVHLFH